MEIALTAADGYRLGATTFGCGERALLVMPATGVPQAFIRERFRDSLWREAADWLEAQ